MCHFLNFYLRYFYSFLNFYLRAFYSCNVALYKILILKSSLYLYSKFYDWDLEEIERSTFLTSFLVEEAYDMGSHYHHYCSILVIEGLRRLIGEAKNSLKIKGSIIWPSLSRLQILSIQRARSKVICWLYSFPVG